MIKKSILVVLIMIVVLSFFVSAEDVAYIVKFPDRARQKYIDILSDMNFTADIIEQGNIANVNFSKYSFLLINDDIFNNPEDIPVNKFPSLILNTWHLDDFHWSNAVGKIASSGYLQAYINNPAHFITKDFPTLINVYINRYLSYQYLPKKYKAVGLKTIASLPNVTFNLDALIATAEPGTRLRDNVYSDAKGVFFGINNHNKWTNYTEQLFRNSITWLTTDFIPPKSSNITVKNRTNESAKITWDTDKDSNSIVYYGEDLNLDLIKIGSNLVKNHIVLLDGLEGPATYYYKIGSCNKDGYCGNSSIFNFTTLDLTPPNPPKNLMLEVINDNSIKVMWDSVDDAAQYNIYIADSPYSFDFENPDASAALNEYIDNGASDVQQRYYIVRAEDFSENEEKNENIVAKFDLNLNIGYNLVSFPLIPFSSNMSDVMHQNALYHPVSEIKRFNNTNQEFETLVYINEEWVPCTFNKELSNGQGYFFKSDQAIDFTIVGTLPETANLEIKQGMNLFGLIALENKSITDVIIQTPGDYNASELGKRNEDKSYELSTYHNTTGWYNEFILEPGIGYWLKANKDFILTLNP